MPDSFLCFYFLPEFAKRIFDHGVDSRRRDQAVEELFADILQLDTFGLEVSDDAVKLALILSPFLDCADAVSVVLESCDQ